MSPTVAAAKQAERLRQDGNTYFKKERLGAAIDAYTEVCFYLVTDYLLVLLIFNFFT